MKWFGSNYEMMKNEMVWQQYLWLELESLSVFGIGMIL
jgi:hypothetical protein